MRIRAGVMSKAAGMGLAGRRGGWVDVAAPAGWGWSLPVTLQRMGSAFRAKGFDVASLKPAATKTYYVSKDGNDGNSGADWANAKRNIHALWALGDYDRIIIGPGVYDRTDGWQGLDCTRSCAIIGEGDVAITAHQPGLSWALTAAQTYTYQTTRASSQWIFDRAVLDGKSNYTRYALKTSIAEVEASAGSFWISGSTVYVHTVNNRAPDADILVMLNAYNGDCLGNITVYMENIKFYGGSTTFRHQSNATEQTPKLYLKHCQFKYSGSSNGLSLLGISEAILVDCLADGNFLDGFNYHAQNSILPKAIEILCVGRNNGKAGDADNGSRIHDGGSIVRLMGDYHGNLGPNLVESAALESWNLGCKAHE
ncbi:MAG: hypothetical protein IH586_08445, partial [Anaerolineaceae bacterium]|nr:hypothetical protein [Anaerolineaceae bacterium]